eukprot:615684-Amphidinium_carterae.1
MEKVDQENGSDTPEDGHRGAEDWDRDRKTFQPFQGSSLRPGSEDRPAALAQRALSQCTRRCIHSEWRQI